MKPAPFEYRRPVSIDEALDFLHRHGDDAKILAGGQSLVPLLSMRLVRPGVVIDINRLAELDYVNAGTAALTVGALARQLTVERALDVQRRCPLVSEALSYVGHAATRSRGTLAGSLVHADPAAELPAALLALDGFVTLGSVRGERTVQAAALFRDLMTTAVDADELMTAVHFRALPGGGLRWGTAVMEVSRRPGDFALAGAAAALGVDDAGTILDCRLALFGVHPTPLRAADAESCLRGEKLTVKRLEDASELAVKGAQPLSDLHAGAKLRLQLAKTVARRALETAHRRAVGGP